MPASWHVACNSLVGRRGRSVLILAAIALAAALVVAVSSAITSVQSSVELSLERVLGRADVRIIHVGSGRFDAVLLDTVRRWPEVRAATGRVYTLLPLTRHDQNAQPKSAPSKRLTVSAVGSEFDLELQFLELKITRGRAATLPSEIMIDEIVADELGAAPADHLTIAGTDHPPLEVAGVYARPRLLAMLQTPQVRISRHVLAERIDEPDALAQILIMLKDGISVDAFCARYAEALPPSLKLEPAAMARSGFDRRIEASRFGVIVTSLLGFLCASFIIVTALTTSVTEKQRELALMRTLGAFRRQLFFSQLIVGLIFGTLGAGVGIPLGAMLAWSLVAFFGDLLPAGLALSRQGLTLGLIGSIGSGLLGAVYPAALASSVAPLDAMTRAARPIRRGRLGLVIALAAGGLGLQLALLALPGRDQRLYTYLLVGLPALHVAYFILAIPVLIGVAGALGPALGRLIAVPTDLLRRSVMSTPYRHGLTAGALMLGLALLVATWSAGRSLLDDWIRQLRFPDAMVYHPTGISPAQQVDVSNLPFVRKACPIGYLPVRVVGQQVFGVRGFTPPMVTAFGFDPDCFFAMMNVEWIRGDAETAIPRLKDGDAVIVDERFLVARNLAVGDFIRLATSRGEFDFEIVGVVASAGLEIAAQHFGIRNAYMEYAIGGVFLDLPALAERFDHRDIVILAMDLDPDVPDSEVKSAIAEAAPGLRFRSGRMIFESIELIAVNALRAQSAIAIAGLLLASIGMGNVIAASVHSRRYEFGVLRAIGAGRGMVMRVILAEAALLAITGGIVGTVFGLHQAWMATVFYRDLVGIELCVRIPAWPTALSWLVLIAMALCAALPPAIGLIRRSPSALVSLGRNE